MTKGQDKINAQSAPVKIEDNVFIGAHSTILKGVTIGENSIVGACSVVVKSIPANEIWAGNPAKLIRKVK
jgi:acetyltransferase-like isoleucine patch superfamily enzyme